MKLTSVLPLLLLTGLSLGSCKKKEATSSISTTVVMPDTLKNSWKEILIQGEDASFTASFAYSGKLFLYGSQFACYRYDTIKREFLSDPYQFMPNLPGRKPAINKNCYFFCSENGDFSICSTDNPVLSATSNLHAYDTAFKMVPLGMINNPLGLTGASCLNDSNHVLMSARSGSNQVLYYIKGIYDPASGHYAMSSVKKLDIYKGAHFTSPLTSIFNIGNNFLFTSVNDTVCIMHADYSFKKLMPGMLSSLYLDNGNYYLTVIDATDDKLYESADGGETWSFVCKTGTFTSQFKKVGSSLVAINADQLSIAKLDGTAMNYTNLKNDGLRNRQINGIGLLDNKVYISTNAGLFYKSYSDFLNNK